MNRYLFIYLLSKFKLHFEKLIAEQNLPKKKKKTKKKKKKNKKYNKKTKKTNNI